MEEAHQNEPVELEEVDAEPEVHQSLEEKVTTPQKKTPQVKTPKSKEPRKASVKKSSAKPTP
jgi:hypothetical protein